MLARYYPASMGRFLSVDPGFDVQPENPQSWNLYGYVRNNPVNATDLDGRWSTAGHNTIIEAAFPGLDANQIRALEKASYFADFNLVWNGKSTQDPANSFIHGMRDATTNQTVEDANAKSAEFIEIWTDAAREKQQDFAAAGGKGLAPDAIAACGVAGHPAMDPRSVPHDWKPWTGSLLSPGELVRHAKAEVAPTAVPAQMEKAVAALREVFKQCFGEDALRSAVEQK